MRGGWLTLHGYAEEAVPWLEASASVSRQLEDHREVAYTLMCLGEVMQIRRADARAAELLREAVVLFAALRDPWGMRPLCIGRISNNWIAVSESCALERLGATYVREVAPGELITIDEDGIHAELLVKMPRQSLCVFEYIYFSDATSQLNGRYTYLVREALGRELAREYPVEADLVVHDAKALGVVAAVKPKIDGARLIIVDDSIVRGNTMKRLVSALRHYGAKEIHLRSSSPPLRHPCYFGIDIPRDKELIASGRSIEEVRQYIGVDSLGYLSLAGLGRAINHARQEQLPEEFDDQTAIERLHNEFCYGCMETRGWPFDPLAATTHGARTLNVLPRDVVMRGQQ